MVIRINFNDFKNKKDFHLWLKQQCQFPEYYGCNLDAMYDCLTDDNSFIFEIVDCDFSDYYLAVMKVMREAGCSVRIINGNNQ